MDRLMRNALLVLLAMLASVGAHAQTFVAACQDFETDNNTTVETPTCTASGSSTYIVAFPLVGSGAPAAPTSVKWNSSAGTGGTALTIDGAGGTTASFGNLSQWQLASPTAATGTTWAQWAGSQDEQIIAGLIYSGVGSLRTSPTAATSTFFASGTATITATTVSGDMLVGCMVDLTNPAQTPVITPPGAPQVERITKYDNGTPSANYAYTCAEKPATTTSTTLSWSITSGSGTHTWIVRAFVLVPGAAAATLSSPTPSGTLGTSTTATIGATTNTTSGTFYAVVDSSANLSGVTAAQIKAGQKASGAAALAACNAAVSTTTPSCGVTGLSAGVLYSYAAVQNSAGGDSNVVTGTFTTDGIVFDAATASGYKTASSSYNFSHTTAGSNRYLRVCVSMLSVGGSTVTGITYNSVALSFVGAQASVSGAVRVEEWGLVAPATGSNTVAVTLSTALDSAAGAGSYTGVQQTSPRETYQSAQATNVGAADATVAVTTVADNAMVVDCVASDDTAITVGAGQVESWNTTGTLGSGAASREPKGTAGSVTMSWTAVGAAATWSIGAVALRPVAAGALGGSALLLRRRRE